MKECFDFLLEIDKLKRVIRRTYISDGSRNENTAEHSWHVAMMAMTLWERYEHKEEVDLFKSVKMLLLHDIVEVDAGDTYAFDEEGYKDKIQREKLAADRLYGLLPEGIKDDYRKTWEEYEEAQSPEATFAHIIDHIQPLMLNIATSGVSWKEHGIRSQQVLKRNEWIQELSPSIYRQIQAWVDTGKENGWLKP
ncbi:HD domain-containing protein [Rossellomorea vietnamensis]|uniref:5'-deoxynucleotidase n=2 Tax=Rossellomorea TaxID=2837508 RepID=A0A5D4KJ40_9BACI|nr:MULTISPECIES: HD domain-containing protein [Rossellomorea]TYR77304.1 HD domain-containing protein [Rossellomorea vietnamensis]TYS78140.1 HD domain-containing protein [Rossellomorea aquimaris]